MDVIQKARILSEAGNYDSCGPKSCAVKLENGLGGIYNAKSEHKDCRMFKTLISNSCSYDCAYCGNRAGCIKKPVKYEQDELIKLALHLRKTRAINGLFLSSGVGKNPDDSGREIIDTIKKLRTKFYFNGYIHLKILPGMSKDLIKEASLYADRLSINIETPTKSELNEYSTNKDFHNDLIKRQRWIKEVNPYAGQSTQMIISNTTTDKDVINMSEFQYTDIEAKRVYYSAFSPVKGTPLEGEKATDVFREKNLYRVDALQRIYGFKAKEFKTILDSEMLPREDPKLALAKNNFSGAVDVNESNYEELIRVPGIGTISAKRILESKQINSYLQLQRMGVRISIAKAFLNLNGKRQTRLLEF